MTVGEERRAFTLPHGKQCVQQMVEVKVVKGSTTSQSRRVPQIGKVEPRISGVCELEKLSPSYRVIITRYDATKGQPWNFQAPIDCTHVQSQSRLVGYAATKPVLSK